MHDHFILYIHITLLENHRYIYISILQNHLLHFFYPEIGNVSSHPQSVYYLYHVIDESLTEIQHSTPS